jgi:hypothetical protein
VSGLRRLDIRLLAAIIFVLLVLATVAMMISTQRVRRFGLVIDRIRVSKEFTPNDDGNSDTARIRFRLTRPEHVDLFIVDQEGQRVRQVLEGRALEDQVLNFADWDGLDDEGKRLPPGTYELEFRLRDRGRTVTPDKTTTLVVGRPDVQGER